MSQPLRIAVLSAWHVHAEEYGRAALDHLDTELVAVWDEDQTRGQQLAERLGVEFAPDLDALLARTDLDGVTVTTATTAHPDVIGRALAAGKHVFTEKLLAPTVDQCRTLIEAAEAQGVALTVSLPRLYHGYTLAVQQVLESGRLGQVVYSRVRIAHNGAIANWLPERFYDANDTVGGAFTDLGAHPVYLTQLILGTDFTGVKATYGDVTGRGVDDNASVTVSTPAGAIGVIETGFVSGGSPFSIEIEGTQARLHHNFDPGSMWLFAGAEPERVEIPADADTPFQRWVADIRAGRSLNETATRALELTALVERANESAQRD